MKRLLCAIALSCVLTTAAFAHCEIPCGIYDDQMRLEMIDEDIRTIEKSMEQIVLLQEEQELNYNQIVRWVNNKEVHADKIRDVVCQYFMAQRIGPQDKAYQKKIALLHKMVIAAMKAKQTVDPSYVEQLRALLAEFSALYFEK